MKFAIVGYGRMGREIEQAVSEAGHETGLIIDIGNRSDLRKDKFGEIDAAIEFSAPEAAFENVKLILEMGIPVVSGTTGWQERYPEAAKICINSGTSFIHSSNFSIGVNIMFRLNSELARLLNRHHGYKPFIEEIHHTKKLDAPSGTAVSVVNGITEANKNYSSWAFEGKNGTNEIPVRSVREGDVPGTHIVEWTSEIDRISLKHEAFGRKGFAAGAVMAAEFIATRRGVFTMADVLGF